MTHVGEMYVGITGLVTVDEVNATLTIASEEGYDYNSKHMPMLGFLVSKKTLGGSSTANRRYPRFNHLSSLLEACVEDGVFRCLPMIHFNMPADELEYLADNVYSLFLDFYKNKSCRALQLNIANPPVDQLNAIMQRHPDMQIVFQANRHVLEGKNPVQAAEHISPALSFVTYVLIDPSGGSGSSFDIDYATQLYRSLKSINSRVGVGFAGGLSGENVTERVATLRALLNTDQFCIDAESGLRDKLSDVYGDDVLNMSKVRAYLREAKRVLP